MEPETEGRDPVPASPSGLCGSTRTGRNRGSSWVRVGLARMRVYPFLPVPKGDFSRLCIVTHKHQFISINSTAHMGLSVQSAC